jgi:hypothetical protein
MVGATQVTVVAETVEILVAGAPPNNTVVTVAKFVPVMVTGVAVVA